MAEEIKLIMLGRSGTGKSSIIRALKGETVASSTDNYNYDSYSSSFKTEIHGKQVSVKLWDTSGRSTSWRRMATYKGVHGVIFTYNTTSLRSLQSTLNIVKQISFLKAGDYPYMLVGTKCDIADKREVDRAEAKKLAVENKLEYMEVSAVTKEGISELLPSMVELVESMSDKIAETQVYLEKELEEQAKKREAYLAEWKLKEAQAKEAPAEKIKEMPKIYSVLKRFLPGK